MIQSIEVPANRHPAYRARCCARMVKGFAVGGIVVCMFSGPGMTAEPRPLECDQVRQAVLDYLQPGFTLSQDEKGMLSIKKGESFIVSFDCDPEKKKPVIIAFFGKRRLAEA